MVLLISVAGALGFSLILWSHGHFGGNFFDSWSEDISKHSIWMRNLLVYLGSSDDHFSSLDLGSEYCFVGIICSKHNGQLLVVDPTFFPVDSWLCTGKPWVA
jgi:hypothetical protein